MESIATEGELEEVLSHLTPKAVREVATIRGDLVLLGVGGKMGPTLARMARRLTAGRGPTSGTSGPERRNSELEFPTRVELHRRARAVPEDIAGSEDADIEGQADVF